MIHFIYFILNVLLLVIMPLIFTKARKTPRIILNYSYIGCLFVFASLFGAIFSFRISSAIQISGGNIAYVAILMTTLFMTIIERDLTIIRNIIYSAVLLNIFLFLVYQMIYIFLTDNSIINPLNIPPSLFYMTFNIVIAGTILIIFELILIGVLFEKIKKYFNNFELISLLYIVVFILILILDGFLFPIFAFTLDPNISKMITGGIQGKLILGIIFSIPILFFMILNHEKLSRYIEQPLPFKDLIFWSKRELIQQIQESEEKYRKAYNLVNFHKKLLAHDMSNILQCILSSADLYSMFRNDPEKLKELGDFSEIVKNHTRRGAALISNVRKLSKLDETEVKLSAIEILDILNKAVENTTIRFQDRNVNIEIDGILKDMKILGNELLIDIFDNILSNAVKYNNNEEEVRINIIISQVKEDDSKYLRFEFKDHGIGVPDEVKENLFKKLFSDDINKRGMGMGLSLVKKIVEKYSGKIWAEDRVKGDYKKGSNFIILLKKA